MGSLSPLRTHDGVMSLKLRSEGWGGTGFEEEHIKKYKGPEGKIKDGKRRNENQR